MNQVALVGRTTKDLSLRNLSEGRVMTNFILAIDRNFKNSEGEVEADFVLCVAWGRNAEKIVRHCGKGSLISVSGRIQSRSYEREDKTRVYVTEVVTEHIRFLATKQRDGGTQPAAEEQFSKPPATKTGLPIF